MLTLVIDVARLMYQLRQSEWVGGTISCGCRLPADTHQDLATVTNMWN